MPLLKTATCLKVCGVRPIGFRKCADLRDETESSGAFTPKALINSSPGLRTGAQASSLAVSAKRERATGTVALQSLLLSLPARLRCNSFYTAVFAAV